MQVSFHDLPAPVCLSRNVNKRLEMRHSGGRGRNCQGAATIRETTRDMTASSQRLVLPESLAPARDLDFTSADFQRVRQLIYQCAGISLAPTKQEMVYSRLARRVRARGLKAFAEYLPIVEDDSAEREAFVNALTTNLTAFFREAHHFEELTDLVERCRQDGSREFKVWSCASSTGEEPYSIAMTLIDAYGTFTPPVSVFASDIDTNVLAQAERGVYTADRIAKLTDSQRRRFFLKGTGKHEGTVRVRNEVRSLVAFDRMNLLDPKWSVSGPFDAIFCRNVMIYFDKATQRQILQKLAPLLRPHGLLFAGHSECFVHAADVVRLRGKTVYEPTRAAVAADHAMRSAKEHHAQRPA
jgi:chemotaxis protein methyltransferase CheR